MAAGKSAVGMQFCSPYSKVWPGHGLHMSNRRSFQHRQRNLKSSKPFGDSPKLRLCPLCCTSTELKPRGHRSATTFTLEVPGGCPVHVFGAVHFKNQAEIGDFILSTRPSAVVVETALCPGHGASTGSTVDLQSDPEHYFMNMWMQIARNLVAEPEPLTTANELWQRLRGMWIGEQLAYIAAMAVSSKIVFGDRVKHDTFRRLNKFASLADLDYAFGVQSALNFEHLLTGSPPELLPRKMGVVDHIMLTERDAVLCRSLHNAASASSGTSPVVGILGEAHCRGVQELWSSGAWRDICADVDAGLEPLHRHGSDNGSSPQASSSLQSDSTRVQDTSSSSSSASEGSSGEGSSRGGLTAEQEAGVKRALLESVIRLKTSPGVVADLQRALGPLPEASQEAYLWAHELYASPRMLLAVLSRDQLRGVCSGWECVMWDVLEPLRAVRPIHGGCPLCPDLNMELRSLNFDL